MTESVRYQDFLNSYLLNPEMTEEEEPPCIECTESCWREVAKRVCCICCPLCYWLHYYVPSGSSSSSYSYQPQFRMAAPSMGIRTTYYT